MADFLSSGFQRRQSVRERHLLAIFSHPRLELVLELVVDIVVVSVDEIRSGYQLVHLQEVDPSVQSKVNKGRCYGQRTLLLFFLSASL